MSKKFVKTGDDHGRNSDRPSHVQLRAVVHKHRPDGERNDASPLHMRDVRRG